MVSSSEEDADLFCFRAAVKVLRRLLWILWTANRYSKRFLPMVVRLRLALFRRGVGSLVVVWTGLVGVSMGTHREACDGRSLAVWVRLVTASHTADAVGVSL